MERKFKAIVRRELHTEYNDSITYFDTEDQALQYLTDALIHPHPENPLLSVGIEAYDGEDWNDLGINSKDIDPYDFYKGDDLNFRHSELSKLNLPPQTAFLLAEGNYEFLDTLDEDIREEAALILNRCDRVESEINWQWIEENTIEEGEPKAEEMGTNFNDFWEEEEDNLFPQSSPEEPVLGQCSGEDLPSLLDECDGSGLQIHYWLDNDDSNYNFLI